jgi:hypothetical protein
MVAPDPLQSGRVEARTGLRMMPTFPPPPLSFRTAGFPRYGWKAGISGGAFPRHRSVKPAPGMPMRSRSLPPSFAHLVATTGYPALCRACGSIVHRHGGWGALRPRNPRSGPGYAVLVHHHLIGPIRPTRGHIAISPIPTYTQCLRCAGVPRRPTSGSEL